jgi:hypothetical protein
LRGQRFGHVRRTHGTEQATIDASLAGDLDTQAFGFSVEAERRFGEDYFVSLEARFFGNVPRSDPVFSYSDDDFIQLRIARYF